MEEDRPPASVLPLSLGPDADEPPKCALAGCDKTPNYDKKARKWRLYCSPDHARKVNAVKAKQARSAGGGTHGRSLAPRLTTAFTGIGTAVYAIDQTCGTSVLMGAESLGVALDHLAHENPSVRRVLEAMLTTSAWGEVMMAAASITIPILQHHGVMPGGPVNLPFSPQASSNGSTTSG